MEILETIVPAMGIALCAIALLQLAQWSSQSLGNLGFDRQRSSERREGFRKRLEKPNRLLSGHPYKSDWSGLRHFRVDRLEKETSACTSVYLVPEDGKPIPSFRPGQHLTIRVQIPGHNKPVVRCYSLSNGPDKPYFRISVKRVPPPLDRPELPVGKASHFLNEGLQVGDRIAVKAPAGSFYLDELSGKPVVLLAGGIGITPMISMMEYLVEQQSPRMVLLAYGMTDSADHAFKKYLEKIGSEHENVYMLNCYSQAAPEDRIGQDHHADGYVSVDLLRKVLPNKDCDFYLCGPPPFMNALYSGLTDWGVNKSQIRFEAFGPASVGKAQKQQDEDSTTVEPSVLVKFANSNSIVQWDGSCQSLLELAEKNEIEIDSGCRAGSCGTCSTELVAGRVRYPDGQDGQEIACEPGQCLVCIARPDGPVELGL